MCSNSLQGGAGALVRTAGKARLSLAAERYAAELGERFADVSAAHYEG